MPTNTIKHIAFIMDGNNRWAKKNKKSLSQGYSEGLDNIFKISNFCILNKIEDMTIYALSTENTSRGSVNVIFSLIENKYDYFLNKLLNNNQIKIKFIGERQDLPDTIIKKIENLESKTNNNEIMNLNIAFNYGTEKEIINIVKNIVKDNESSKKEITTEYIKKFMYLKSKNDPDILIRTGGFQRLSNFILLNLKYTELFFTDSLWPELDTTEVDNIFKKFQKLERKYGQ